MRINEYVDAFFAGSKAAFARKMNVDPQQVTKWVKNEWQIIDGKLHSPKRDMPDIKLAHSVFDVDSSTRFPLYMKYDNQYNPQSAYISLDLRDGKINADYSGEIGNSVPSDVWHGLVRRYTVPSTLMREQIQSAIEDNLTLFQAVLSGSNADHWNGNNYVGILNDDATAAEERLVRALDGFGRYDEIFMVDDIVEWYGDTNGAFATSLTNPTLDNFVDELLSYDGDGGGYFTDVLNTKDGMREAVLDMWANVLYNDEEIPEWAAKELLQSGKCDDSQWMDELSAFASKHPEK